MKYNQPFDQPNLPNASYVNGDPGAGIAGSIPPAAQMEYPQRELVNVIGQSGQIPSNGDLFQLTRAIRSGRLDFAGDTGTSDALAATIGLGHNSLVGGLPFSLFKGGSPNATVTPTLTIAGPDGVTGASISISGRILKANGSPVAPGDLPANALLTFRCDGANFRLVSLFTASDVLALINAQVAANFIISSAVTVQVGGAAPAASTTAYPNYFATLAAAFAWVSAYTITSGGSVTFALAAGQLSIANALVGLTHPNASRIFIQGAAMKGALPVPNSFAASGNTAAARNADRNANLTSMRALYGSEINFPGGGGLVFGNGLGGITNTLVTGDTATANGLGGDLVTVQGGNLNMTGTTVGAGGGRGVLVTQNGSTVAQNCYAFGCLGSNWSVEEGGRFIGTVALGAYGSAAANINVSGAGTWYMDQSAAAGASITSRCAGGADLAASGKASVNCGPAPIFYGGVSGVVATDNAFVKADGAASSAHTNAGFQALNGSTISALNTTSSPANGTYGYLADVASSIYATGGTCTGGTAQATPAFNTVGNHNSFITQ